MVTTHKQTQLDAGHLTQAQLKSIQLGQFDFELSLDSHNAIERCHEQLLRVLAGGETVYGINTGFGFLAKKSISKNQLAQLQENIIVSHNAGVGEPLSDSIVRLILATKINSLAQGYSGVRPMVIDYLMAFYHGQCYPVVPCQGSVGASGDLAPLAALAAPLLGYGQVRVKGDVISATSALDQMRLSPLVLEPKEGLALINGTQVSNAIALDAAFSIDRLLEQAIHIGAMSLAGFAGSTSPFSEVLSAVRRQPGQIAVAAKFREYFEGAEFAIFGDRQARVQDPYSMRCQVQVLGACYDQYRHALSVLINEANAVTDNPLLFAKEGVLTGGNFHAQPVAFACDNLALVVSEIGALSERRMAQLIDPRFSGLPAFLTKDPGINSGFMVAHVSATALASENKALAHPRSIDSLPTSANQEDHVSMATNAALRLQTMIDNTRSILAIELMMAAQALDLRMPVKLSPSLESLYGQVRALVAPLEADRLLTPDIEALFELLCI